MRTLIKEQAKHLVQEGTKIFEMNKFAALIESRTNEFKIFKMNTSFEYKLPFDEYKIRPKKG